MATGLRSNVESRRKRTQSRGPLFFAILLKLERQQWSSRRKAACTLSHDPWPAGRQTAWHSTIRTRARAHSPMRTPVPAWLQGWEGGERASIRPKPIQLLPPCGACRPARRAALLPRWCVDAQLGMNRRAASWSDTGASCCRFAQGILPILISSIEEAAVMCSCGPCRSAD